MAKYIQLKDGSTNCFAYPLIESLSSGSLNDINRPTVAWVTNGVTDQPGSSGYGVFICMPTKIRFFFDYGTAGSMPYVYISIYTNNQWYAWKKIATTAV